MDAANTTTNPNSANAIIPLTIRVSEAFAALVTARPFATLSRKTATAAVQRQQNITTQHIIRHNLRQTATKTTTKVAAAAQAAVRRKSLATNTNALTKITTMEVHRMRQQNQNLRQRLQNSLRLLQRHRSRQIALSTTIY